MTDITVAAEKLRDEVHLYSPEEVRYVDGKIEVPVGHWAWQKLREIAEKDAEEEKCKNPCIGCNVGWGSISSSGESTHCHTSCDRYQEFLKLTADRLKKTITGPVVVTA